MASGGTSKVPYTLETTDFDDVLIKHGIVSREQALIAKGMSVSEANALLAQEAENEKAMDGATFHETEEAQAGALDARGAAAVRGALADSADSEDERLLDEAEDLFSDSRALERYREQRLAELREEASRPSFGELLRISRQTWLRDVNEASRSTAVIVNLVSQAVEDSLLASTFLAALAARFPRVKFCEIPSTQAIEGWPDANLPAVFAYRGGEMCHQFVGRDALSVNRGYSDRSFEWRFAEHGLVETDMESPPRPAVHLGRRRDIAYDDEDLEFLDGA